ncbi:MAG: low temperature requirement protein A [Okeania sp. SIO3B3]|nr:low temperature requirement protein A [Okeania sp. SIO3B3]
MPHLVERYGLLPIIVLGEAFIKIITDAAGSAVTWDAFFLVSLDLSP